MLKAKRRPWAKALRETRGSCFFVSLMWTRLQSLTSGKRPVMLKKSLGGSQITVLVVACCGVITNTLLLY